MSNKVENYSEERPTRVRYGVMGLLCSLAFVLYIDRICIAQAATEMMADLDLSNFQWGLVGVAFQIAYAIFEPATGHWGDRFGSRKVLIRIVLWWSAFTALTGCVWKFSIEPFSGVVIFNGFVLLLLVRFLFGAGEAGALPNAARVISVWFPPGKRGPPQSLISTCAQIGGATAPLLAAFLIQSPYVGWRWAFVIFGSLGLVWCLAFAYWFQDDPTTHPGVNDAERRYILSGRKVGESAAAHLQIPWAQVLTNRNIYLLGLISACSSFFSYMLFSWFPTYLKEGRALGELHSGLIGSIPYLFGATGVFLGGYLGDWLTARTGSRRLALGGMGTSGLLLAGLLVGASIFVDSPILAVLCCSLGFFFSYIQLAAWWATMADVGGKHLGALFGVCNMVGLAGGALSQVFLGRFADYQKALGFVGRDQWDPAFYLYAGVLMLGGLLWLFVDPKLVVRSADGGHD